MMHVLQIAALAHRMASWFSHDATRWRPEHVHTPVERPIPVAFRFVGGTPAWGRDLLEALRLRIAAPFTGEHDPGVPIVAAGVERPEVEIELRAEERHEDAGIAYELRFASSDAVLPGWFRLG